MGKGNELTDPAITRCPWARFSLTLLCLSLEQTQMLDIAWAISLTQSWMAKTATSVALKTVKIKVKKKKRKKGALFFALCVFLSKNAVIISAWFKVQEHPGSSLNLPLLGCNVVNKVAVQNCCHFFRQCHSSSKRNSHFIWLGCAIYHHPSPSIAPCSVLLSVTHLWKSLWDDIVYQVCVPAVCRWLYSKDLLV